MRIGVPRETVPHERRVALVPDGVSRLVKAGVEVIVERGAGGPAGFDDAAYAAAGAALADDAAGALGGSQVVTKVQRPSLDEARLLGEGSLLVSLMMTAPDDPLLEALAARGVTTLALERVPRITRAQSMDVLSSQSTVAGYKAVLLAASALPKFLPMLTTAAGSIAPARALVIGAGVAGLQAIATARRLGAVVAGFDIRPAAREQVQSLGATFVAADLVSASAEDKGGYAKAQGEEEQRRTREVLRGAVRDADFVICTAQVPGRPAPRLVTAEMVAEMRRGSVIVDLAAESGGNCELTRAGEEVEANGVRIIGPVNLASSLPMHASQMLSRNILTLLQHVIKDGALALDASDEIVGPMCVTRGALVAAST